MGTIIELNEKKRNVAIHTSSIEGLKKEFMLTDDEVNNFLTLLIDKSIQEHIAKENSKILNEAESKELEEDLRGLGYL